MESKLINIVLGRDKHIETPDEATSLAEVLVKQYALLKHPHYALTWNFIHFDAATDYIDLHRNAIFSLLVNHHDDLAREKIVLCETEMQGCFMNLDPLLYCVLDDFPPATQAMCEWLLARYSSSAAWHYYITGWSIMGEYNLVNLKFAKDHQALAERLTKHFDAASDYEIYIQNYGFSKQARWNAECHDLIVNWARFKDTEPTIDIACELGTCDSGGLTYEQCADV